jgi:hypothetical protein
VPYRLPSSALVRPSTVLTDAICRTTVLVSLDNAGLPSDGYQLFERCARVLSTILGVLV